MKINDTIGIEIEVENINLSNIKNTVKALGFSVIDDASVMSYRQELLGKKVYSKSEVFSKQELFGGEIISHPFELDDIYYIKNLVNLCDLLKKDGEDNYRSSIHIHVNVGDQLNLVDLKSIIRWATRLESVFFRFGSYGRIHRGEFNNFNYCRPITYKGPLVFFTKNGYGQVLNTIDLLKSKSVSEFWDRYGDCINYGNKKYHPVRYHWINLFSIFRHGSLEFRVFNQTTNLYEILATILLCQATTQVMLKTTYKELCNLEFSPINSVFYPVSNSREILEYVLDQYDSDPTIKDMVFDIFDKSKYPKIQNKYVFSHMIEKDKYTLFENTDYCPDKLEKEEIENPNYLDKHKEEDRIPYKLKKFGV